MPGGEIVLVTGASSGFGKLTAALLAERGYVGKEKNYLLAKRLLPFSAMESMIRRHWRLDG